MRASLADLYLGFVRQTLEQHPCLRATRLHAMLQGRGYTGSVVQLRRAVARLRPQKREEFLQLHTLAGEQGQVDWAHFGHVMVGRARRALFLLRDDPLLLAGFVPGVLLRSNDGETSCAGTCMGLRPGVVNHA